LSIRCTNPAVEEKTLADLANFKQLQSTDLEHSSLRKRKLIMVNFKERYRYRYGRFLSRIIYPAGIARLRCPFFPNRRKTRFYRPGARADRKAAPGRGRPDG
jgi:hypothetical protein